MTAPTWPALCLAASLMLAPAPSTAQVEGEGPLLVAALSRFTVNGAPGVVWRFDASTAPGERTSDALRSILDHTGGRLVVPDSVLDCHGHPVATSPLATCALRGIPALLVVDAPRREGPVLIVTLTWATPRSRPGLGGRTGMLVTEATITAREVAPGTWVIESTRYRSSS